MRLEFVFGCIPCLKPSISLRTFIFDEFEFGIGFWFGIEFGVMVDIGVDILSDDKI